MHARASRNGGVGTRPRCLGNNSRVQAARGHKPRRRRRRAAPAGSVSDIGQRRGPRRRRRHPRRRPPPRRAPRSRARRERRALRRNSRRRRLRRCRRRRRGRRCGAAASSCARRGSRGGTPDDRQWGAVGGRGRRSPKYSGPSSVVGVVEVECPITPRDGGRRCRASAKFERARRRATGPSVGRMSESESSRGPKCASPGQHA